MRLPSTLQDANARDFRIEVQDPNDVLNRLGEVHNPFHALAKVFGESMREDDYLRFDPGA